MSKSKISNLKDINEFENGCYKKMINYNIFKNSRYHFSSFYKSSYFNFNNYNRKKVFKLDKLENNQSQNSKFVENLENKNSQSKIIINDSDNVSINIDNDINKLKFDLFKDWDRDISEPQMNLLQRYFKYGIFKDTDLIFMKEKNSNMYDNIVVTIKTNLDNKNSINLLSINAETKKFIKKIKIMKYICLIEILYSLNFKYKNIWNIKDINLSFNEIFEDNNITKIESKFINKDNKEKSNNNEKNKDEEKNIINNVDSNDNLNDVVNKTNELDNDLVQYEIKKKNTLSNFSNIMQIVILIGFYYIFRNIHIRIPTDVYYSPSQDTVTFKIKNWREKNKIYHKSKLSIKK